MNRIIEVVISTIFFIPPGVKKVIFKGPFNRQIDEDDFPDSVKTIIFEEGSLMNRRICWPRRLKKLKIYGVFNHSSINDLPNTVEKIYCSSSSLLNVTITRWPTNLKVLHLEYYQPFNKPLINLPQSIKEIQLGDHDLPLPIFPEGLEILVLGHKYNHPIKKINIPSTIVELVIGNENWDGKFNEEIETLEHCTKLKRVAICNKNYSAKLPKFPNSIEELMISRNYPDEIALPTNKVERYNPNYYNSSNAMCIIISKTLLIFT